MFARAGRVLGWLEKKMFLVVVYCGGGGGGGDCGLLPFTFTLTTWLMCFSLFLPVAIIMMVNINHAMKP